jgi:SAM-dependent methyltransferase
VRRRDPRDRREGALTALEDASQVRALVERLTQGLVPLCAVFAANELGLFDLLAEPRSVAALAERAGLGADAMTRLVRALGHLGLLRFEDDVVDAPPAVRDALATTAPGSLAPLLRHHHHQLLPPLLRLAEAARTGLPQHASWPFAGDRVASSPYEELGRSPVEVAAFLAVMEDASRGVGTEIARAVDLSRVRTLLDVGGGGGGVARELLAACPALTVESVDLPAAVDVARAASAAAGLEARHRVRAWDVSSGLPDGPYDAVLLSALLADLPREERDGVVRRAARALAPGGLLLVSETLLDDDRRGPAKAAMLSLVMLAAMRGDQLSGPELTTLLEREGLVDVRVRRGAPRDLVFARRAPDHLR